MIRLHVDYIRREGASPRTMRDRRGNLLRLADKLPVPLLDATPEILDTWQSNLTVCLSSIATYTSHTRAFYLWCYDVGHLDTNPAQRLARTKVPPRLPRPIPRGDFEMALECAPEPIATWLVLGAYMGLRAAEIAGIHREHITEAVVGGQPRVFITGIGKGGKPYKQPVPAGVEPILRRWMTARPGPLWLNHAGRPLTYVNVSEAVSKYFRGLDMPYTLHWTRHTFGTELQHETRDILATKVLMRHTSVNTTLLYVEPGEGAGVDAMDRLSGRLDRRRRGAA